MYRHVLIPTDGSKLTAFFAAPPATPNVYQAMLPVGYANPEEHEQMTILAAARKRRCDLVFMASHGRRGLRRSSLLGSVTQKVLSASPLPVLVYRP